MEEAGRLLHYAVIFGKVCDMDLMNVILAERALAAFRGISGYEWVVELVVSNIDAFGKGSSRICC